eukprot:82236_1
MPSGSAVRPMSKSLDAGIAVTGVPVKKDKFQNVPNPNVPAQNSYPGEFQEQVQFTNSKRSSISSITSNSMKRTGKKIVDRAIPITTRQKRSRWIPGKRYFPLLLLQWIWHPISTFLARHQNSNQRVKERDVRSHDDPRHHFHDDENYQNQHRSVEESQASIFADSGGDLFME